MPGIVRNQAYVWGDSDPTRNPVGVQGKFDVVQGVPYYRSVGRIVLAFANQWVPVGGLHYQQESLWTPGFLLPINFRFRSAGDLNRLRLIIIPTTDININEDLIWLYE